MGILELLLREPGLTHNEIFDELNGNRNKVLKAINDLVRQGFIREENQGRKRKCFLTKKGEKALLDEAFKRVDESLRLIQNITSKLVAEKTQLEDWRKASSEALLNVKITEEMPLEERIEKVLAVDKRTFGLLTESYKNMHRLICEVSLWKLKEFAPERFDPAKFFIGFPDGVLHFIHVQFLEEKGLYKKPRVFNDE
jgi:predicted transcriptional regulator